MDGKPHSSCQQLEDTDKREILTLASLAQPLLEFLYLLINMICVPSSILKTFYWRISFIFRWLRSPLIVRKIFCEHKHGTLLNLSACHGGHCEYIDHMWWVWNNAWMRNKNWSMGGVMVWHPLTNRRPELSLSSQSEACIHWCQKEGRRHEEVLSSDDAWFMLINSALTGALWFVDNPFVSGAYRIFWE